MGANFFPLKLPTRNGSVQFCSKDRNKSLPLACVTYQGSNVPTPATVPQVCKARRTDTFLIISYGPRPAVDRSHVTSHVILLTVLRERCCFTVLETKKLSLSKVNGSAKLDTTRKGRVKSI